LSQCYSSFGFNKLTPFKWQEAQIYYGALKEKYGCIDNPRGVELPSRKICTIGDNSVNNLDVLIVGDSHAMASVGMLNVLLKDAKLKGYVVTQSGTPFILGNILNWRKNKPMNRNAIIAKEIKSHRYKYVAMGGFWNYYPNLPSKEKYVNTKPFQVFRKGLRNAVKYVLAHHATPIIILDNPLLIHENNTCGFSRISFGKCYETSKYVASLQKTTFDIITEIKKEYPQVILLNPSIVICKNNKCPSSINGIPLYMSTGVNTHMSYAGSTLVGQLLLNKQMNPFNARN
jgi:hypothetical protein